MAIKLQVSNSLSQLSKTLFIDIHERNIGVFQANYLVTQTEGMNNWLKLQMASALGIAANYRFLKPNDLIYDVFHVLGGQYLQALSPESQSWLLFKLLAEPAFRKGFPTIAQYYLTDGQDEELKRMALAEKLADLFDQYQIYRPELIRQWNKDTLGQVKPDEWEKYIWIKAKLISGDNLPDKTIIGNYILDELKKPEQQAKLRNAIPVVHVFGLSVITDFHIQLFYQMGLYTDISFYLLNPAPGLYWFEDRSEKYVAMMKRKGFADASETGMGNALLTSWGNVVQNTFGLLFKSDELINAYNEVAIEEPLADSLLHKIQGDIFFNRSDEERNEFNAFDIEDGSITINSCYTPVREVEVLYNYLVHLVDKKNENLSAREIVVMVSDIDTYAPYIKAVFNNARYKFPYSIADESYMLNDTIAGAMHAILSLNTENFKAEAVLQLLDLGYIRRRFALSDIAIIRTAVKNANIRFGMDGLAEDDSIYVSWQYGLQRIIYGICMSGSEEYFTENDSLYPLDLVEGGASLELVRFCHFIEVLMDSIKERRRSRTIAEWGKYIEKVLNNLVFEPGDEADEDYTSMLKHLEQYNLLSGLLSDQVSYEVFIRSFLQSTGGTLRSGTFAAGGITFCSLIPMRSIPFKVVALLGLDFDKFPRKESPVSFNLMERERRKGDRNIKENDKHLFLETLLSARTYLYISYLGQSVKDNTSIPPSALVDELIDYIDTKTVGKVSVKSELVTKHPLHGFSKIYAYGRNGLYSYLQNEPAEENLNIKSNEPDSLDFSEIRIESLLSFFRNPAKAYYNKVLNIYYQEEGVLLSDTELFELDSLQKWSLKQQLLLLESGEVDIFRQKLVKTGGLPLRNMSEVVLNELDETVRPIKELFADCTAGATERKVSIELAFENIGLTLIGDLKGVYDNKLVLVCWSGNECKYHLDAYLRYLIVRATDLELELFYISSKKAKVYQGAFMSSEEARKRLEDLLKIYKIGHSSVLPFWPDFPFQPKDIDGLIGEKFIDQVGKKLKHYEYPCTDLYIMNKFNEGFFATEESFSQYHESAQKLIVPLAELFPEYYN